MLVRRIPLKVKVVKLQAQFGLAAGANFEEHMLEIRLDGSHCHAHLKSELLILVPHAGEVGYLPFARRKGQPAVIQLKSIFVR
jgi:hypothetical protein